jgi:hypothetical protein
MIEKKFYASAQFEKTISSIQNFEVLENLIDTCLEATDSHEFATELEKLCR